MPTVDVSPYCMTMKASSPEAILPTWKALWLRDWPFWSMKAISIGPQSTAVLNSTNCSMLNGCAFYSSPSVYCTLLNGPACKFFSEAVGHGLTSVKGMTRSTSIGVCVPDKPLITIE